MLLIYSQRHLTLADGISDEFGVKTGSCKVNAARQDLVALGAKVIIAAKDSLLKPTQALQEDTQLPQTSVPIPNVTDETVFKEWDDRVVRATTTDASLDAAHASGDRPRCQEAMRGTIAQTRFERVPTPSYDSPLLGGNTSRSDEERFEQPELTDNIPPTPHDSPLSGGYTPGSDEGRFNITELMAICTQLSNRVLALEHSKTAQDLVIKRLTKKVKRLEKKLRARTPGMKLFKIGTSKRKSLDKENVSKHGRKSDKTKPIFDDNDFAKLDVDNAMENVEGDAETQGRNTTRVSTASASVTIASVSISTAKPRTVFEDEDLTIAQTLVKMRSEKAKEKGVALRDVDEFARPTRILLTIDPKDKGKGIMQEPEKPPKNSRKFERKQRIAREKAAEQEAKDAVLITQMEDIQARMDADELLAERLQQEKREQFTIEEKSRMLVEMIAKKKRSEEQSTEKEKELSKEELQKLLVIVPVEEVYVEALQIFDDMLKKFDREDLVKLWDLVKKRFNTTEPTDDKEKELCLELRRLFEPDSDDILWKLRRGGLLGIKSFYNLILLVQVCAAAED
ncbi:hypothetical protein Tco_0673983 [Tanacetum coccineum]